MRPHMRALLETQKHLNITNFLEYVICIERFYKNGFMFSMKPITQKFDDIQNL